MTETAEDAGAGAVVTVGSLRRGEGGLDRFLLSAGEVFTGGVTVDWPAVFTGSGAAWADLPTYAFQHERYWLEPPPPVAGPSADGLDGAGAGFWAAVAAQDVPGLAQQLGMGGQEGPLEAVVPALSAWYQGQRERSVVDSWRYRITWVPVPVTAAGALPGRWLVITPGDGGGERAAACAAALRERAGEVIVVTVAGGESREELAGRLSQAIAGGPVAGVVSLLALDDGTPAGDGAPAGDGGARGEGLVPGCSGLAGTLVVIQALGDAGIGAPLWCLTCGAVAAGGPVASPGQAQVWGLGRVAALEYPQRWGGLVDVPAVLDGRAAGLLAAVLAGGTGEDQAAVRGAGVLGGGWSARRWAMGARPAPGSPAGRC